MAEVKEEAAETPAPMIEVSPSPHLYNVRLTTKGMMLDVLLALASRSLFRRSFGAQ